MIGSLFFTLNIYRALVVKAKEIMQRIGSIIRLCVSVMHAKEKD